MSGTGLSLEVERAPARQHGSVVLDLPASGSDNIERSGSFQELTVGRVRGPALNTELQAGFEERVQQLRGAVSRSVTALELTPEQQATLDWELLNYHKVSCEAIARSLNTSLESGLSPAQAQLLSLEHGKNVIAPPRDWPLWAKYLWAHLSGFSPLLWFASLVCFLSWEPLGFPNPNPQNLGLAIVLIVVILFSAAFTFWQELQTARTLAGFCDMIPATALVTRAGAATKIPAADLTIGDIITLETGARVPADVRVSAASNLKVDKSMLTGESEPARITAAVSSTQNALEAPNMLFMGTTVTEGTGRGIVVAVGNKCQIGRIAGMAATKGGTTTLQREINAFVRIIASFAATFGVLVMVVWGAYLKPEHPQFMSLPAALGNMIGVVVAFVPEGLPLALSVGLTIVAKRLCDRYSLLLKQLGTVETLGSMSLVASDKTGTLTQNKMTVITVLSAAAPAVGDPEDASAPTAAATVAVHPTISWGTGRHMATFKHLLRAAFLCNDAKLKAAGGASGASAGVGPANSAAAPASGPAADGEPELASVVRVSAVTVGLESAEPVALGGNGVDKALLLWSASLGAPAAFAGVVPRLAVPFNSTHKCAMAVVPNDPRLSIYAGASAATGDGLASPAASSRSAWVLVVKGAAEALLPRCVSYLRDDGTVAPLTPADCAAFQAQCEALGALGQRLITLAERPLPAAAFPPGFAFSNDPAPNFPADALVLVGALGVSDPPRPGVREAVRAMRTAGLQVAMVTGDAQSTAVAIARQVGIVTAERVEALQAWPGLRAVSTAAKPQQPPSLAAAFKPAAPAVVAVIDAAPAATVGTTAAAAAPEKEAPAGEEDASAEQAAPAARSLKCVEVTIAPAQPTSGGGADDGAALAAGAQPSAAPVPASLPNNALVPAVADTAAAPGATGPTQAHGCRTVVSSAAVVAAGPDLALLDAAGWDWLFAHSEIVLARMVPEGKLAFVSECQRRGHRVAVTGDGVNDAPALKKADCGIAMNSGSDVARDAAHVVLLTDDFTAITEGVKEGRLLFANLRKLVAYQISAGCWSELWPVLANVFIGVPLPLSTFLMIVISCLTDVGAGIALIYTAPEGNLMREPPRDHRTQRLVTWQVVLYSYGFVGMMQVVAAFVTFFMYMGERGPTNPVPDGNGIPQPRGYSVGDLVIAWDWGALPDQTDALNSGQSVFFMTLVMMQVFHVLSVRRQRSPYFTDFPATSTWGEWAWALLCYLRPPTPILLAWIWELSVVVLFTEVPYFQAVFGTSHVPGRYWGVAVGLGFALFVLMELRKWVLSAWPAAGKTFGW